MNIAHPGAIWLIPPALAVAFLLWVLWNFCQDEWKSRKNDRAAEPQLIVQSQTWDRPAHNPAPPELRSTGREYGRPTERIIRS